MTPTDTARQPDNTVAVVIGVARGIDVRTGQAVGAR